ncbi:MAG TPA: type II toxin-antitoxin system RelE/ParE family toxin [Candidatus Paceibacterota bacterium]
MGQEERYSLRYHRLVPSDLARLDTFWHGEVLAAIESKLLMHPEFFGKPLRQSLKGWRKLRVGDYRIVFRIEKRAVQILAIVHRSTKYKGIEKRV